MPLPDLFKPDGTLDPAVLASKAYDSIEFRTRLTPPIKVPTVELSEQVPAGPWVRFVQPAFVLRGRAGTQVIAPFGLPNPVVGAAITVGVVLGLIYLGYVLGRAA